MPHSNADAGRQAYGGWLHGSASAPVPSVPVSGIGVPCWCWPLGGRVGWPGRGCSSALPQALSLRGTGNAKVNRLAVSLLWKERGAFPLGT